MDLATQVASLSAAAPKLSIKDQEFALSLCGQFGQKHSLSEKQAYWVGKLLAKATPSPSNVAQKAVGAWEAFFKAIPVDAKRPAVILTLGNPEEPTGALKIDTKPGKPYLRLSVQTVAEGKAPKAGRWIYVGTLRQSGDVGFTYMPGGGGSVIAKTDVLDALQMLAADTIAALKVTGKAFGICANCGRLLTHPASIEFGIGPVCSGYLGLGTEYAAMVALVKAGAA